MCRAGTVGPLTGGRARRAPLGGHCCDGESRAASIDPTGPSEASVNRYRAPGTPNRADTAWLCPNRLAITGARPGPQRRCPHNFVMMV